MPLPWIESNGLSCPMEVIPVFCGHCQTEDGGLLPDLPPPLANLTVHRNTEGTLNSQPRVHKFHILFTPQPSATVANRSGNNPFFTYNETILFYGPNGTPTTGLDADGTGHLSYPGFLDLPAATYQGDGFGNPGPEHKRIPINSDGIILTQMVVSGSAMNMDRTSTDSVL